MADKSLDARNLNCPLPILKAKKTLSEVRPGGTLEVFATDPGSVADFESFCDASGHALLAQEKSEGGVFRFLIRRRS